MKRLRHPQSWRGDRAEPPTNAILHPDRSRNLEWRRSGQIHLPNKRPQGQGRAAAIPARLFARSVRPNRRNPEGETKKKVRCVSKMFGEGVEKNDAKRDRRKCERQPIDIRSKKNKKSAAEDEKIKMVFLVARR